MTEEQDNIYLQGLKTIFKNFSEEIGFNIETEGILDDNTKRFSGMPFVGNNYGKYSPKILFIGSDIGSDEGNHDFESKRKRCIPTNNKYNAHLAGTYMVALYHLKDHDKFKKLWNDDFLKHTARKSLKEISVKKERSWEEVATIANAIALTNLHKFVTKDRRQKEGDADRKNLHNKEMDILIKEIKCFKPDIVIFQQIPSAPKKIKDDIKKIKDKLENDTEKPIKDIYIYDHPSTRKKDGQKLKNLIINRS